MAGNRANLQVGLQFSADTKQAKAQLADLSRSLENLVKTNMTNLPLTDQIKEATNAAAYLKASLDGATNASTGKLDISKFSESLKQGGYSAEQLKTHLQNLGPEGIKAFQKVAVAVSTAEAPTKRLSGLMANLLRSFGQTAKYQFTASIYRGLIGGIQSAYHYAQDLNESLNNIRIVTGQSTEQMARFAEQANKAAQALSTTTTDYTNAALIYYQQGLNDEEVRARTDVTMKLANASGVSAETASQQLTAIWNNFAKGAENLEYFADVMTALGASTASSTSEIAEGLEKFAAIGNTVGLSYEYAASALATVTATTRQSADVVGTAFKTLFARIQDLEVGETLEDGTTLGKYSQALAAVGVNIKDANGELKAMDQILEEMAAAWGTIAKDQQVALAQTVAGTRQYTQLVALMENWSFMQQNLQTSYNSTGTVQKQQEIYAESWEAARDRVTAAAESIYKALINDEFFIDLLNFFEKFLREIKVAIDALGGLRGVLFTIGNMVMTFAGDSVAKSINNSIYNVRDALGLVGKEVQAQKDKFTNMVGELSTAAYGERVGGFVKDFTNLQSELLAKYPKMTQEQRNQYDLILKQLDAAGDVLKKKEEELEVTKKLSEEEAKREKQTIENVFNRKTSSPTVKEREGENFAVKRDVSAVEGRLQTDHFKAGESGSINQLIKAFESIQSKLTAKEQKLLRELKEANSDLEKISSKDEIKQISQELIQEYKNTNENIKNLSKYKTKMTNYSTGEWGVNQDKANQFVEDFQGYIDRTGKDSFSPLMLEGFEKFKAQIKEANGDVDRLKEAFSELRKVTENAKLYNEENKKSYEELEQVIKRNAEVMGKLQSAADFKSSIVKVEPKDLDAIQVYVKELEDLVQTMKEDDPSRKALEEGIKSLNKELVQGPSNVDNIDKAFHDLNFTIKTENEVLGDINNEQSEFVEKMGLTKEEADQLANILLKLSERTQDLTKKNTDATRQANLLRDALRQAREEADKPQQSSKDWGKGITGASRALSGLGQTINTVNGFIQQAKDGTLNLTSVLTTIPSIIFGITSALNGLKAAFAVNPILGGITIAIGLIAGTIAVINKIKNASKEASELAAKKAEELAEAYDKAKKAAEGFKNTASNYSDAVKELDKLTQGTEEYSEKLKEANLAAQELLNKYGDQLSGKWTFDSNGLIKIDQKELKNAQISLDTKALEASNAAIVAKMDANEKADRVLLEEISRNNKTQEAIEIMADLYSHNGKNVEDAFNSLDKDQKELISKVDQSKLYTYLDSVNNHQLDNVEYSKQINGGLSKFNQDYINNVQNEELKNYFKQFLENESAKRKEEASKQAIEAEDNTQKFINYTNQLGINASGAGKQVYDFIKNNITAYNSTEHFAPEVANIEIQKLFEDYIDSNSEYFETLVSLSSALNHYKQALIDGNEEAAKNFSSIIFARLKDIPLNLLPDQLKQVLNDNNLTEALNKFYEEGEKQDQKNGESLFETFSPNFKNTSDATNFILGLTRHQVNSKDFTYESAQNFGNQIDEIVTDEMAKMLGWVSDDGTILTKSLKKSFHASNEELLKEFEQLRKNSLIDAEEALKDFSAFTLEDQKQIEASLSNAFVKGGNQGFKNLQNVIKNQEDPIGLLEALNNIDWRNSSLNNVQEELLSKGYVIGTEALEKYQIQQQKIAQENYILTAGLDAILKDFKDIYDVINKIDFGSFLSDEEYNKLPDALQGDFVRTPQGWMFIGDPTDLQDKNKLDLNLTNAEFAQARKDIASINKNDLENLDNNSLVTKNVSIDLITNSINPESVEFNETVGKIAGVTKQALIKAIQDGQSEGALKVINDYANTMRQLAIDGEKQFSKEAQITSLTQANIKSIDELTSAFNEYKKELKLTADEEEELYIKALKVASANEIASKGIDSEELINQINHLKSLNGELAQNEEALYRVATANVIAAKAYENTVSTYESNLKALEYNDVKSKFHTDALNQLRGDLADMLSITEEALMELDAQFFLENRELYKRIAQGDEEAMYELTANAMIRTGDVIEQEKEIYIEFIKFMETNPGQAEIEVWYTEHNKPSFLQPNKDGGFNYTTAADAAGTEFTRKGEIIPQGGFKNTFDFASHIPDNSKASKKNLKYLDDEIDRYHYIRKQLADIERELERVNKAKERAYGAQHLKYLDQEIEYLKEQAGLQDKYVSEIEGYLAKDRGLMAAYGAQFDEFGNISNYNQLFAANFNKYANADDSTNWENFKKALSTYEETLDLWFEQTEEKAEILRQILDKQLEGIQYKVNVKIELDDRELALLEYQLNRLDDAAYDTAEALVNIGSQFEVVEDKIKATTDGIVDTLKTIPGITQAQIDAYLAGDGEALAGLHIEQGQIDMLEDYSDQLLELSNTLKDLHDNALQKVSEAFDAWGEKIEDHTAKFQHLNALIENYQEIIGLLGRSNIGISNEFMREMRNQQITNLQGILNTRTQAKDVLAAQLADARKRATEATTQAEKEDWEQVADDIEQRLKEATESWQQAWIDALQANKEAFEETMQELVDSFNDYEDELKRYDTAQDRYLETYRQAYELSKLTRDIENSINDQDSIRAKKELQKLEDKITEIKESGRAISENELGLLQKEYELRLAEIALEDAQNAKSLVRLNRDNQGNWGYVYTADQDKIDEAQQNYEDKLYEYMRAADTMAEEASRTILTLNKEMAEALAALDANAVDYEAKVAEITQFYSDQIGYFAEQYGVSTDAMVNVARESATKYKPDVVDIIDSDNSGLQTNFAETVLAIIGNFEDLEDAVNGPDGALPNIQRAYDETLSAFKDYQEQNAETCKLAGSDINHMAENIKTAFDGIKTKSEEINSSTEEMTGKMSDYLGTVLDKFGTFASDYSSKIEVVSKANVALADSIIGLEKALNSIDASSLDTLKKAADKVDAIAQKVREVATDAEGSGNGSGKGGTTPPGGEKKEEGPFRTHLYGGGSGFVSVLNQLTFDTGGYTGEWGTDGRLAVLHQKELVLNQEDTANILDAVSLIRQMTLGTAQLSMGLGTIGAGLNNLNINPASMDQKVEITASFPGVTDRYEIEEAFNNLVNKASQYAFRETRYQPRPDFI